MGGPTMLPVVLVVQASSLHGSVQARGLHHNRRATNLFVRGSSVSS
jgi:hypothetical protein